jgi:CRP-like cAMP-binding protein
MTNPLVRQLEWRDGLSDEEKQLLDRAIARVKEVQAGEIIVSAGARPTESCLILEGLACRYKILPRRRRQITAFHVPGDFADLHSFILKRVDHTIAALTLCKIALVPHATLLLITEKYPHLGRLLWLCTLIDGAANREWLATMGSRPAAARAAHLFCELFTRLNAIGQTKGKSFSLPLTQSKVGEALGLSSVHVNRVLQQLRAEALITWADNTVTILDWKRLCQVAQFDPSYLYFEHEQH